MITFLTSILILIGATLFFVIPHFFFYPFSLDKCGEYRDYFYVSFAVFTFASSLVGVYLGNHYFEKKKDDEKKYKELERKVQRFEQVITELNHCDALFELVINKNLGDDVELNINRVNIFKTFDYIECMLEVLVKSKMLIKADVKKFVKLRAFIEKSSFMLCEYGEYLTLDVDKKKDDYRELFKEARMVCFLSIV